MKIFDIPTMYTMHALNKKQQAKKISQNSAYGAVGNEDFRYYKLANAEAITTSGQVAIKHAQDEDEKITVLPRDWEERGYGDDDDIIIMDSFSWSNRKCKFYFAILRGKCVLEVA